MVVNPRRGLHCFVACKCFAQGSEAWQLSTTMEVIFHLCYLGCILGDNAILKPLFLEVRGPGGGVCSQRMQEPPKQLSRPSNINSERWPHQIESRLTLSFLLSSGIWHSQEGKRQNRILEVLHDSHSLLCYSRCTSVEHFPSKVV